MNTVVKAENLSKVYKSRARTGKLIKDLLWPDKKETIAVNNISFEIKKGESVALLGPNGAGKTTTMKMLSGLLYPTSGSLDVLGFYPFDRKKEFLMNIGLVMGYKTGLDWDLTPRQSFQLFKRIYRLPEAGFEDKLEELLSLLEVKKYLDTQVRRLSLGERMKMELIGAILHSPDVLFLDEPTIGLDIISKQKIREFLREIQKKYEVTLLLTSHDMLDVEKVCDRVIVINKGVIVADKSLENLSKKYGTDRYIKVVFEDKPDKKEMKKIGLVEGEGENYFTLKIGKSNLPKALSEVTRNFKFIDIEILSTPLEDIIADIYRHKS